MSNDSDGNAILNYQSLVDGQEINLNIDVSSMNDSEIQNLIAELMDQASGDNEEFPLPPPTQWGDIDFDDRRTIVEPMPEEGEWDGRREAYRIFADKLWDKANDEDEFEGNGRGHHGHNRKKGGCHGKNHHGGHGNHGKRGEHFDDGEGHQQHHKGKLGFCPVLATVYVIMAVHFYTLYSFQKALSDEEFLEKANDEFNSDFESRQSTSAQHFFSNMMGPEPQRRQCQEVLSK